ncbi:MAG TPA: tetratricopeptide repeat protein [Bryobacteraceae bacterium]|nr:tetratricopeptide repeat protein [Bryobacteraceae bacterium]
MARWAALLLLSGLAVGVAAEEQKAASQQEQEPPEEDQNLVKKTYEFNPLQATKEVQIGNFYYKKGSYRAAAQRFREATRWNAQHAEAWLRLAETSEKLKDPKAAREAYAKYLELEPQAKNAAQIRRKLAEK